jgi:hypothetical protein
VQYGAISEKGGLPPNFRRFQQRVNSQRPQKPGNQAHQEEARNVEAVKIQIEELEREK